MPRSPSFGRCLLGTVGDRAVVSQVDKAGHDGVPVFGDTWDPPGQLWKKRRVSMATWEAARHQVLLSMGGGYAPCFTDPLWVPAGLG